MTVYDLQILIVSKIFHQIDISIPGYWWVIFLLPFDGLWSARLQVWNWAPERNQNQAKCSQSHAKCCLSLHMY